MVCQRIERGVSPAAGVTVRRLVALAMAAGTVAGGLTPMARAANLLVDQANGNNPFTFAAGTAIYDTVQVGVTSAGTVNQTGGTLTAGTSFVLGVGGQAVGTYNLAAAGTLTVNGVATLGQAGVGLFTESGGTARFNGGLTLAGPAGSYGSYDLNGGTLLTALLHGNSGSSITSLFNFNGGTLRAIAASTTFLQGMTTANVRNAQSTIDTNGFNVTIAQALRHSTLSGDSALDGGLIEVGAGTLTLSGANTYTGNTDVNAGTLAIVGGTVGVSQSAAFFRVDSASNSAATPVATLGGRAVLTTSASFAGYCYTGTFTQTGGTHTTGTLYVGSTDSLDRSVGSGLYTLSGGTINATATQIGVRGSGTFTQTGGTHTTPGLLIGQSGATGAYVLSAGQLTVSNNTVLGSTGPGTFTQTGGTYTTPGLQIGRTGTTGACTLAGTGQLTVNGDESVGLAGTGTFSQSGGTHQVSGILYLGYPGTGSSANTGQGTYTLSGGTLQAGETQVGNHGEDTFTQTAGTVTSPRLFVGLNSAAGVYNLSGTGQLTVSSVPAVGYSGAGTLNQSGGTATFGDTLFLSAATGGSGSYNLNGGVLSVPSVAGNSGGGTNATFNFNGGTLKASGNSTSFLRSLTAANVRNGGAIFDTGAASVTVAQPLVHSSIAGDAAVDGGLTKLGAGTLILTGANTYQGATTVSAGTLSVKYGAGGTGAASPLLGGAGGANVQSGRVVFDYSGTVSPLATVRALLAASYTAATTPGVMDSGQLRSSTATAARGLGYSDDGAGHLTVMATPFCDANLDGKVNFNDFLIFQANFGVLGTRFDQGNFNYDSATDFNDFLMLQANFGQSVSGAPVPVTTAQVAAMTAFAQAIAVPEPAGLVVAGLGVMAGLRRRRR